MNKAGLVEAMRKENGLTRDKAEQTVGVFFEQMSDALTRSERVEIRGFCSIYVKDYAAYKGRNPKTGKHVYVKSKKLPFFKCGTELRKRVDSAHP